MQNSSAAYSQQDEGLSKVVGENNSETIIPTDQPNQDQSSKKVFKNEDAIRNWERRVESIEIDRKKKEEARKAHLQERKRKQREDKLRKEQEQKEMEMALKKQQEDLERQTREMLELERQIALGIDPTSVDMIPEETPQKEEVIQEEIMVTEEEDLLERSATTELLEDLPRVPSLLKEGQLFDPKNVADKIHDFNRMDTSKSLLEFVELEIEASTGVQMGHGLNQDPLSQSIATQLTEIVGENPGDTTIESEEGHRISFNAKQGAVLNQNFLISEKEEVKTAIQQSDSISNKNYQNSINQVQFGTDSQKQRQTLPNRKEKLLVEMELKSRLNQIQRAEKNQQNEALQEKQRIQQAILSQILGGKIAPNKSEQSQISEKEYNKKEQETQMPNVGKLSSDCLDDSLAPVSQKQFQDDATAKFGQQKQSNLLKVDPVKPRDRPISGKEASLGGPRQFGQHSVDKKFMQTGGFGPNENSISQSSLNDRDSINNTRNQQTPLNQVHSEPQFAEQQSKNEKQCGKKQPRKPLYSCGYSQLDERTDMTSLNKDSTFDREELSEMMVATSGKDQTAKNETELKKSASFGMNDRDNAKEMINRDANVDNLSDESPEQAKNIDQKDISPALKQKNDENQKEIERKRLQDKLKQRSHVDKDKNQLDQSAKSIYSEDQMEVIRDQLQRISQDNGFDEDEEFKLAESFAFNLSQKSQIPAALTTNESPSKLDPNQISREELAEAVRRSQAQVKEEANQLVQSHTSDQLSFNYSLTQQSRPTTTGSRVFSTQRKDSGNISNGMGPATSDSQINTLTSDQFVNSVSRSQLPQINFADKEKMVREDENNEAGQARGFYYDAEDQSMNLQSEDFDDQYEVSGQSAILKDLQNEKASFDNSASSSQNNARGKNRWNFGKQKKRGDNFDNEQEDVNGENDDDQIKPEHEMIEDSSNSMVNMAISMDPLTAGRALSAAQQKLQQKQKEGLKPLIEKMGLNDGKKPDQINAEQEATNQESKNEETNSAQQQDTYSQDDFEKEDDLSDQNVDQNEDTLGKIDNKKASLSGQDLDLSKKFQVTLGASDDEISGKEVQEKLQDTSRFGGDLDSNTQPTQTDQKDNFYDQFDNDDEQDDVEVPQRPKRAKWGQQSFGVEDDCARKESEKDQTELPNEQEVKDQSKNQQEKGDESEDFMVQPQEKKEAIALDIGLDSDTMKDAKMKKFEDFKMRQELKAKQRQMQKEIKQQAEQEEKKDINDLKFAKKKPQTVKENAKKIKRPERKICEEETKDSKWDNQIYESKNPQKKQEKTDLVDKDLDDESGLKPPVFDDCNFDISPNKITDDKDEKAQNHKANDFGNQQDEDFSQLGQSKLPSGSFRQKSPNSQQMLLPEQVHSQEEAQSRKQFLPQQQKAAAASNPIGTPLRSDSLEEEIKHNTPRASNLGENLASHDKLLEIPSGQAFRPHSGRKQLGQASPSPNRGAALTPATTKTPSIVPKKAFTIKSNKQIIKNALMQVSLPGDLNKELREQVTQILDSTDFNSYIVVFKGVLGSKNYKALYHQVADGEITKIHGPSSAPTHLKSEMVEKFFKYNSGAKEFKSQDGQRSFTTTTDAVSLKKEYQQAQKMKNIY